MSTDTLTVRFETPEALRQEFEKNISNRGVFVATEAPCEVRQAITVEIVLDYPVTVPAAEDGRDAEIGPGEPALVLDGEIVHVIGPEMAASGAVPGVAVQFEASASDLCARFEPLLGAAAVVDPRADTEGAGRRSARRGAVRIDVQVRTRTGTTFATTSRDLSATGILLSVKGEALPVGEIVRLRFGSPLDTDDIELPGKIIRHVRNKKGRIAAMAVAFDRKRAAEPGTKQAIETLREEGHSRALGGISGSIAEVGLPSLIQMFGASAPAGTLVVESEGEQGSLSFDQGQVRSVVLGERRGREALLTMLEWRDGRFQFEASADPRTTSETPLGPIEGVLLDAVSALDERRAGRASAEETQVFSDGLDTDWDGETEISGGGEGAGAAVGPNATFDVDVEQEDLCRSSLDKTEDAILELAKAGMSLEKLCEVIPERADVIEASVTGLVELGVLLPR